FNEYKNNQDQIINLIQLLTKLHIAVPDETGKMNYHLEEDFYKTSKVNLVIFFANNYKDYKWDENKYSFVNTNLPVNKTDTEMNLFDLLSSKIDTVAINSFIELTQLNSERVFELSEQYERSGVRFNYKLPTFAYRFLK